jgi:hypothetical protein
MLASPKGGLHMKTDQFLYGRFSIFLIFALFSYSAKAQRVSIYPNIDSINIVGSCTPPQMICTLEDHSLGIDTIIIRPSFYDPLCTGFPPTELNTIQAFNFIIRDSLNQFHYELILRPMSYPNASSNRLGFDTSYFISPQLYMLVLNVYSGSSLIDSSKIKLRSYTTGSVEDKNNLNPILFVLEQNYPNPFNPSTSITFFLSSRGFVSLKIFDSIGKEVTTLVSSFLSVGNHSIQWNAEGLPSGIYYYCLRSGIFSQTKKLCLLK